MERVYCGIGQLLEFPLELYAVLDDISTLFFRLIFIGRTYFLRLNVIFSFRSSFEVICKVPFSSDSVPVL